MSSRTVATNRKARYEYSIEDSLEAGVELTGPEVKSVRDRRVSLGEAYARIDHRGQVWLENMHIARYDAGGKHTTQDPARTRRLLLHKREIRRLERGIREKGYTLIPLSMYFNERGYAKIELGLCRGKRQYEKRDALKARDEQRRTDQAIRDHQRGR
jgi:SsrA-binding protein